MSDTKQVAATREAAQSTATQQSKAESPLMQGKDWHLLVVRVATAYFDFSFSLRECSRSSIKTWLHKLWPITFIMQMNLNRVTLTFAVWLMLSRLSPGFLVFPLWRKTPKELKVTAAQGDSCQRKQQAAVTARYLASARQMPTDDVWCCVAGLR